MLAALTNETAIKTFAHWIDGQSYTTDHEGWIDSTDPATGAVWSRIPAGGAATAERAAAAAARAMTESPWGQMTPAARGKILHRLSTVLLDDIEVLAETEMRDTGKLLRDVSGGLAHAAELFRYFAGLADKVHGRTMPMDHSGFLGMTRMRPVGPVLAITAWNAPLLFLAQKAAPALAAGCSVVVKPSEFAAASSLHFAALASAAGLPDGVLNVVTGLGPDIGEALLRDPRMKAVSFTGSVPAGRRIAGIGAAELKRVTMELGGKSPNIIFNDADLSRAIPAAAAAIFASTGQICVAGSRLLVQDDVHDQVVAGLIVEAERLRAGDPRDPQTGLGPISTRPQYDRVRACIAMAHEDGARCVTGGGTLSPAGFEYGYFVQPTIFTGVRNDMRIAREEVFGPVLSVIPFRDEAEAIALANDTAFGLAAAVWTRDNARMLRMAEAIEAGTVWGNTYRIYNATMPFGGMKQSGLGRESGVDAIHEFLEVKSVILSTLG